MKIVYQPSETKTYQTTEIFSITCEEANVGMWVFGDSVRFVGWFPATAQFDEMGFRRDKLTTKLLLAFVDAYNKRNDK